MLSSRCDRRFISWNSICFIPRRKNRYIVTWKKKTKKKKTKNEIVCTSIFFFFFSVFLGPCLWHMEVPRLEVESELQLPVYPTATEMPDPRRVCNLHQSSQQCWILDRLSKARDQTCVLMETSWACCGWDTTGTPVLAFEATFVHIYLKMHRISLETYPKNW